MQSELIDAIESTLMLNLRVDSFTSYHDIVKDVYEKLEPYHCIDERGVSTWVLLCLTDLRIRGFVIEEPATMSYKANIQVVSEP